MLILIQNRVGCPSSIFPDDLPDETIIRPSDHLIVTLFIIILDPILKFDVWLMISKRPSNFEV